jgi:hypothetical protein
VLLGWIQIGDRLVPVKATEAPAASATMICQRVPHQALHGGAGDSEACADQQDEQDAGEPNQEEDGLLLRIDGTASEGHGGEKDRQWQPGGALAGAWG